MKIYYLGYINTIDGYGQAARQYIELLSEMGHEVDARDCNNPKDLERSIGHYDVAIAHMMPIKYPENVDRQLHLSSPFNNVKCKIWMTVFETSKWPAEWKQPLSYFDKIITHTNWQTKAAQNMDDRWVDDCYLIPHIMEQKTTPPNNTKEFIIYSEFSRLSPRKGIDILLKAYLDAFSSDDNVKLNVKIMNHDTKLFHYLLDEAKRCFPAKLNTLPKLDLYAAYLEDAQMDDLMSKSDLYVCSSRGEGFCLPLAKAISMGIDSLSAGKWADYLEGNHLIESKNEDIYSTEYYGAGMAISTKGMIWVEPSISDLSAKMRIAYDEFAKTQTHKRITDYQLIKSLSKESIKHGFEELFNELG